MGRDHSTAVLDMEPVLPGASRIPGPRGLTALALLAVTWCLFAAPSRWEWDTVYLYEGLFDALTWARRGFDGPVNTGPFPPFQYLTGMPLVFAGMMGVPANVFSFWIFLNLLSLGGVAWVLWRAARRYASMPVAWLLVVVILTGPLIAYAPSTFNELTAAFVTVAFAAAVVGGGGPVVAAVLMFAVGLTKEIAAPLLVPIWLAGLWLRREELGTRGIVRHVIAMVLAFGATAAAHMGFNWLRYGTAVNLHYLSEERLVRPWGRRAQNAVAVWFAPNGGVAWFWPTLVVLMVAAGAVAWRRRRPTGARLERLMPAGAVVATMGGLTVGLAGFFQPFGWWCWGPRYFLPWLPAALLVLVRAYPGAFHRAAVGLLDRRGAFLATAVLACALALPHLLMIATPSAAVEFFRPDTRFPRGADPEDVDLHYARQVYLAWGKWPPMLVHPFAHAPPLRQSIATAGYLAAIVVLLWRARASLLFEDIEPGHVTTAPRAPSDSPPQSAPPLHPAAPRSPAGT